MPRNVNGVMSKPSGTEAAPNETIASAKFNATIDDIISDLNAPRPVTAGGTGAVTEAAARTALDVAQKQASNSDATAGRGLIVGAFGLGGTTAVTASDWNGINRSGYYRPPSGGSATGAPTTSAALAMHHVQINTDGNASQTAWATTGSVLTVYSRFRNSAGTWSAWSQIYHPGNIVGTVSQTAGVPTGAVIETNSISGRGFFTKWADGTLLQWWRGAERTTNSAVGAIYRSDWEEWEFPVPFVGAVGSISYTPGAVRTNDPVGAPWGTSDARDDAITLTKAWGLLYGPTNTSKGRILHRAIGRWF